MDHKSANEKLQMYFLDELTGADKNQVEKHIGECEICTIDLEELKRLRTFLSLKKKDVPDKLLNEARQELRARLRIERNRSTLLSGVIDILNSFRKWKLVYVLSGAAVFVSGLLIGFLLFNSDIPVISQVMDTASEDKGNIKINNVKFIDSDASDGEVEFTFDAIKPVRIKGDINDEQIKSVLMHAMLNEENPGVRLNTVNFVSETRSSQIDPEVKAAVLTVLKYDGNPGVRREAISFIKKLPYDEDIKSAYLYVLMNDSVSGLRIDAMNGLFEAAKKGELFTKEELSIFKEKMREDDNSYIRLRAQTVLKEYN